MQLDQAMSTPIHNNINRKGILRRFDRKRLQRQDINNPNNNLRLDFISCPYQTQKCQLKAHRASILSSIRCRNIRNRNNEDRKKQIHSLRENSQDFSAKFELTHEGSLISTPRNHQIKNSSDLNMLLSKRTSPVRIIFSRSKTSRTHYIEKKQSPNLLQVKGLIGYQINKSLMNRKISVFSS